ncbi:OTU domain-containing protein 4 isoform X1, partial [Clarias magur]
MSKLTECPLYDLAMERRAGVDAPHGDERSVERLMDAHLKAHGLCRKRIAKDGSCLFRAVAEQVLHCQSLHTRVRAECVKYLREKRDLYESFIEGDFEEYLRMLQDPQSWVGQVEISALAVLYKHDFIIYQNPGEAPVNITQNGYPDKVLLCFLNGNHYDSVYPVSTVEKAAVCQSILYELLYERVFHVDRSALMSSLRMSKGTSETIITEERESSGNSDLDEGEDFWSGEATSRPAGVNNRTAYKGRGRGHARGVGRGCLLRKVQESMSPSHFRNVEYEVWLRSKRVQQRRDFCMAAGMHYKAGDKCQVRLNNTDRFYSAYIQDVSADDGPVTVFIEELGEKYSVPLWNLRSHSEESWSTVTEKTKRQTSSSTNGHTERDIRHGRRPMRSMSHGSPQSTVESQSLGKNGSSRKSDPGTGGYSASLEEDDHALLELLNKDEENFPSLEASAQAASIEGSRRPEKKGTGKKVTTDTKEQSLNPSHKPERGKQTKKSSVDQDQGISPPPKELTPTQSSTLPAPSDPKLTTAAPVSKTPHARVPYKSSSSISARIPPVQSQTAPAPSSRPPVSSQTTHIQSPTASAPSTKPLDSSQITPVQYPATSAPSTKPVDSIKTTPIQSPAASTKPLDSIKTTPIQSPAASAASTKLPDSIHTTLIQSPLASAPSTKPLDSIQITPIQSPPASAPSSGPPDSSQTTAMQSPTAPAPPKRPIVLFEDTPVKSQSALKPSGVISVSSQTNLAQPQSLPMPITSLNTPIFFQSTPTQCLTMPKTSPVTTTSVPQNLSQTIQSQVLDRPAAVTTPVTLSSVPEAITTPVPFQPTTIPVSTCATAPNPVSTLVSSPSSTQSASSPAHTISQTTSVTTQSPAPTQIPFATEVPGSTELSAASKTPPEQTSSEQQGSADAPSHIHVSHSITPPAQPSLAPSYHIGFGTHLPYPPYPVYPAPMPSFSPNTSAPMPDPCHPPTVPTPPFAHAPQPYLCDPAISPVAGALVPDAPSQHPFSVQQICQDMCYPGFPQNEKGEPVPLPPFSHNTTGNDLPNDTSVLRFFFNLGLK